MTYKVGIELEVQGITVNEVKDSVEEIGCSFDGFSGYHNGGFSVEAGDTTNRAYDATGWRCETDSSLGANASWNSKGGIEIISRPLSGVAGIKEIKKLTKALKRKGAYVDRRCGTHTTFGLDTNARYNRMSAAKKAEVGEEIMRIYHHFQDVIDAYNANNRQVNPHVGTYTNDYCQSAFADVRKSSVNMTNYVMFGIIEFRQLGYTLNGLKIEHWIRMINAIIAAATNENHSSRDKYLSLQPKTLQGMCDYLNVKSITESFWRNRIEDMATKFQGGRQNRLNVLAINSEEVA
tara:strand:+ start:1398 stop:2273 length:876 start_codon:yes stop_codon:yes gene_type:complete